MTGRKSNLIVFEDGTKLSPENFECEVNKILGVNECIVYPYYMNERTFINVKVVVDGNHNIKIRKEIEKIARNMQLSSKLRNIEFTNEELKKNTLGKIMRI